MRRTRQPVLSTGTTCSQFRSTSLADLLKQLPALGEIGARLLTGLLIALTLVPRARREQPGETQDLDTDPTLPRSSIPCPHCGHDEAVFYQDQSKRFEVRLRPGAARRFRDAAR
jgi:hypothetical protein